MLVCTPLYRLGSGYPLVALLTVIAVILVACSGDSTAATVADAATIARGEELYAANCASCHGAQGEGQPNWQSPGPDGVLPAPPHDASGHTWHHPDELLFEIVKRGGQAVYGSPTLTSGMPAFEQSLSDEEIRAILAFIRTLWGPDEVEYQQQVTEQNR